MQVWRDVGNISSISLSANIQRDDINCASNFYFYLLYLFCTSVTRQEVKKPHLHKYANVSSNFNEKIPRKENQTLTVIPKIIMILNYLRFGIALGFISFIVGLIMNAMIKKTDFYNVRISNLNFIKNENFNKFIGIGVVKWIVKNTPFKFFNQTIKIDGRINLMDLKFLRNEMTKSEVDHLFAFLFPLIFIIIKIYN